MESRGILLLRPYLSLFLLLPADKSKESECKDIKCMVKEVNDTQVDEDEILSYSVYFYDRDTDKIVRV